MIHKKCKFFPCHNGIEDCRFCYCPIYPCGYKDFGKFIVAHDKKIWDCSDCIVFHKAKIADLLHGPHSKLKKELEKEHIADK